MSFFAWRDEYSVHNTQIDGQHKELFRIAGELHSAMMRGAGRFVIGDTVTKLIDYTGRHFRDEETLMKASQFPQFTSHKAEHDNFITAVTVLKKGLADGQITVSVDTMQFLRNWLENHIMGRDQVVARHIGGPVRTTPVGAGKRC